MDTLVVTWAELVAFAGSRDKAHRLVRDGIYRRVLRNAFVLADAPDDAATRLRALQRVLPKHVVLCHWTSLWALGLDVLPRTADGSERLDVTTMRGLHLALRPSIVAHSALMTDDDLCEVDGTLMASAARAFVDVCRSEGVIEGVACGDAALRAGLTTLGRIEDAVERASGLRWVTRARAALPHLEPRSESLMESRLRVGFVLAGGPRMPAQVDLYDDSGHHRGRADLYLDGVVVEYDGREERLRKDRFTHDRRRQNDLSDLGLEIRRFTSADYYGTSPVARLGALQRALVMAGGRTRPRLRLGPDTLPAPRREPLPTVAESAQARRTA